MSGTIWYSTGYRKVSGIDAEERKLGERKGLETPVVLAVNDAR